MDENPEPESPANAETKRPKQRAPETVFVLSAQSKEFVINLYEYFEHESQNGGPLRTTNQVQNRVSEAFGISKRTIYNILREKYGGPDDEFEGERQLTTPKNKKRQARPITDINDFTAAAIKNHIEKYKVLGVRPSIEKMLDSLSEEDLFDGGKTSLRYILKRIGYEFVPNGVGQPVLTYKPKK